MNEEPEASFSPTQISGVYPHLGLKAGHFPARTETGIGALMPWADRLWLITYVAHKAKTGSGTGLFTIDDGMRLQKHKASVVGTYANRMIHAESSQLIMGPHVINAEGRVRTIEELVNTRLTATCRHLTEPERLVYFLGMEGELFEVDVNDLTVRHLFDLTKELGTSGQADAHFKDAFCDQGRLVVCNNSYYHEDYATGNGSRDGRLAEWDGKAWTILERTQFNTVTGRVRGALGRSIYAFGQDRASALLKQYDPDSGQWKRWRLPKGTHTQDHAWTTEWPRLREVESERWLLNASGIFYELPAMSYGGHLRGIKPVCSHLRIVGDFCSWNGLLVMAGDQTTPINDSNTYVGQPQANLWFGKTDDLWSWGKPTGCGGPWFASEVEADAPSDPFLVYGFEHTGLHVQTEATGVDVLVEVDFLGNGSWSGYTTLRTNDTGYVHHAFPDGFSAHWIRLTSRTATTASAQFFLT